MSCPLQAYLDSGKGSGGCLHSALVPPGQRWAESLDHTEVAEEGSLGAIHPEEGAAGVRGPVGTHPLQKGPSLSRRPALDLARAGSPCMHISRDPRVCQDRVHARDTARKGRDLASCPGYQGLQRSQSHVLPGPGRGGPWERSGHTGATFWAKSQEGQQCTQASSFMPQSLVVGQPPTGTWLGPGKDPHSSP